VLIYGDNTKIDIEKVGSEEVDYLNWIRIGSNDGLFGTNIVVL